MTKVTITGLQEAQRAMLKVMTTVRPSGTLGRVVYGMATEAHRTLVSYTHVDTGSYRASQYVRPDGPARYTLSISHNNVNPRTGQKPAVYGVFEERRGGKHAAYARTYQQGNAILGRAVRYLMSELP
jgi:hypothetical protein